MDELFIKLQIKLRRKKHAFLPQFLLLKSSIFNLPSSILY